MKIAVTGANGLVGSNLVRTLLHKRHKVQAVVRPNSDVSTLEGLAITRKAGDIFQPQSLVEAFRGCDCVMHTAAIFTYWGYSAQQLEHIAVDGTRNVIDACRQAGIKRLVFTSSSITMGSSTDPMVRSEASPPDHDNAPYLLAKIKQEQFAFEYGRANDIAVIAVCPTMSVGPYGNTLGPSNGMIVTYLSDPYHMTFPGGCNIVSVGDVAMGHLLAAQHGVAGERYILGSENLTWPQIHQTIAELCGVPPPKIHLNHTTSFLAASAEEFACWLVGKKPLTTRLEANMVGRYYWYSHDKAQQALGYTPRPARQALTEAIAWLTTSKHISRQIRSTLRLGREVYQAREQLTEQPQTRRRRREAV